MTQTIRRGAALVAVVAMMALAGACSAGSGEGATATSDSAGGELAEAPADGGGSDEADGADRSAGAANRTLVQVRAVIRTGEVALTGRDLDATREDLEDLLGSLDGQVDSERTQHDEDGRVERSTLVIRVPVDRFGAAMAGIQELGTVERADTSAQDVTTKVIDVDERVQTLETSLDRLQAYQADAADIDDLIRFEQQITEREAELQSLKSQQAYLADQTSMSTITVLLSLPEKYVAPPSALDEAGFLTGLQAGWGALVNSVVVALTAVGAALPFTLVVALVGVPLWLLVRRGRRDPAVPDAATPPPTD